MYNFRVNYKKLFLWLILFIQLLLIGSYFLLPIEPMPKPNLKVSFLPNSNITNFRLNTYHTLNKPIKLSDIATNEVYVDFNTTMCYKPGTDLKTLNKTKRTIWKCVCLPGWHSADCGQPEVVWRALLAKRKPTLLKGPRKYSRRLIYIVEFDEFTTELVEICVNELYDIIDLFIIYESNSYLERKLQNGFLKKYHAKILYAKKVVQMWSVIKKHFVNLHDDDIILTTQSNVLPNRLALNFFKFYDKWPEPLSFRMRWSIYGFFWLHPNKAVLKGGACTVSYLFESLNDDLTLLYNNKTYSENKGFVLGDLNHFGGWFCEFCNDPIKIIELLKVTNSSHHLENKKILDNAQIEDFIENGLHLNGKMELKRAHRSQDQYFAPPFVLKHDWKYDWMLMNLYSKIDYY